jgi:hypothetical protein
VWGGMTKHLISRPVARRAWGDEICENPRFWKGAMAARRGNEGDRSTGAERGNGKFARMRGSIQKKTRTRKRIHDKQTMDFD